VLIHLLYLWLGAAIGMFVMALCCVNRREK